LVEKGLMNEQQAQAATDADIIEKIFLPEFSTKDNVSEISGRGVGMDAVKNTIEKDLNGKIGIQTQVGAGTVFEIRVPLYSADIIEQKQKNKNVA